MSTEELIAVFREAQRLVEQGDEVADAGDFRRACSIYSRAAGVVIDAIDEVTAQQAAA